MGWLKGEIQNRFKLISEERVKIVKQNSKKLMKISLKIRKLRHFEISQILKKHFLTSRYEYANDELMMSLPHNFYFHFVHRNDNNSYFSYENVRLALIPLWIDAE